MSNCCTQESGKTGERDFRAWAAVRMTDPADLSRPLWREVLRLVSAPATRLHGYRNLRTAYLRRATRRPDRDPQA